MTPGSPCRRLVLVSTATGMLMVPASPCVLALMATPRRYRDPDYTQLIARGTIYGGAMRRNPSKLRTSSDGWTTVSGRAPGTG